MVEDGGCLEKELLQPQGQGQEDQEMGISGCLRNAGQAFQTGILEGPLEKKIAGGPAGQGQIGEEEDIGARPVRLAAQGQDFFFIGRHIARPDGGGLSLIHI